MEGLQNEINDLKLQNATLKKAILANKLNVLNEEHDYIKHNLHYEYLALSGGGIKGVAFVGALLELDKMGILYDNQNNFKIKGISGASAGSIVAALLAIGYNPKEIEDIMNSLNFSELITDNDGYIKDAYHFVTRYGLCNGTDLHNQLGQIIKEKTGNVDYTLKNLYDDKNIKLVITTTNLNTNNTVYLHPLNPDIMYSDIPIRVCVRMSISVPFLFEPYLYNNYYFCDGGVLDNYPLHCFDCGTDDPGSINSRYNDLEPNFKTLGLKIASNDLANNNNSTTKINHLYDYAYAYIDTFLAENDRKIFVHQNWIRTIFINTPYYSLTKFNLTEEQRVGLINNGKDGVNEYFSQ
jgi:predicted acylesterase/phospholipase RssA